MNKSLNLGLFFVLLFFIANSIQDIIYFPVLIISLSFPLLFLFFLIKIDVFEKERLKDVLFVFLLSLVIIFFLCIPYITLRDYFIPEAPCSNVFLCFIFVAIPEEIIKLLPFLLVLKYRKFVNEPIDYLIYASTSALGFAFLENINYIINYSELGNIVAIRSFLPSIMHMVTSSIFSFSIFLYVNSKKLKFIILGLIFSSFLHSIYNSLFFINTLVLFWMILYYAKLIQSLLNISPFYDKGKDKNINLASNFLFFIILSILILSFVFDLILNGIDSILLNPQSYIYLLIVPFFVYKIISSKLTLQKGKFIALGKRQTKFPLLIEMQDVIINFYKK